MTIETIKELVKTPAYDFLRENDRLKDNIIFLTLGGSHAYGTNIATSDVDVRGCTLNIPSDLLGFSHFEQFTDTATDTTIYAFNKLIPLLISCNPNTIEMLGCKPDHYLFMSEIGRKLIDNRKLFLSKKAVISFGNYATQQLRRLENALARDRLPQAKLEEHTLGAMERAMSTFAGRFPELDDGSIHLYTAPSQRDELDEEIFADIQLTHYPARSFKGILGDLSGVLNTYEKCNHRNHKKDDNHLNKHAMHLVRLYLTCLDILEKEEIITYRGDDLDLLMSIRRGDYQMEDGTYRSEFFDMVTDFDKRLSYAAENTSLPATPDVDRIEEFAMEVNRSVVYRQNHTA